MTSFAELDAFFDDGDDGSLGPSGVELDPEAEAFFSDTVKPDEPSDQLLERMKTFVLKHAQSLNAMRESLSATLSEAWSEDNDTILLLLAPYDSVSANDSVHALLVNNENQQLNKVVTVFAHLVREANELSDIAETKFYNALTQFGHKFSQHAVSNHRLNVDTSTNTSDTDSEKLPSSLSQLPTLEQEFGSMLPILQDLNNFLNRVYGVARNLLTQLACLYHERQKLYLSTYKNCRLELAFEALGTLSRICLTVDLIIKDNEQISLGWLQYKKLIKYVRADPGKYNIPATRLRLFESLLLNLDRVLLNGECFQSLLEQPYGIMTENGTVSNNSKALIEGNKILFDTFVTVIKAQLKRVLLQCDRAFQPQLLIQPNDKANNNNSNANNGKSAITNLNYFHSVDCEARLSIIDLFGLYALMRHLFRTSSKIDKKLFNELWALQKKFPILPITGRACFFVPEFMGRYCPIETKHVNAPIGKQILVFRQQYLNDCDENFHSHIETFYTVVSVWSVRMQSALKVSKTQPLHTILTQRTRLLLTGLNLSATLKNLLIDNLFLHLKLSLPFRAKNIRSIAIGCELLSFVATVINDRQGMVAEHMTLMIGQSNYMLKHILTNYRKLIKPIINRAGNKKIDDSLLDCYSALTLALQLLDQPLHPNRFMLLKLLIDIGSNNSRIFAKSDQNQNEEIHQQCQKLAQLIQFQSLMTKFTSTSFLYWVPNLIPVMLRDMYSEPTQITRINYFFHCLNTVPSLFYGCSALHRRLLKREFENEIFDHFANEIVEPLCRDIETDLRLHIHSVVLHQQSLRTSSNVSQKDLTKFLLIKPIKFLHRVLSLSRLVQHYLDSTFYNLNTVALHDWRVYAEMRNLAQEKYGLSLIEVHLPGSSHYSDALDILEIMRNIHVFVSRYNYNMNMQFFLERSLDQKHLHSISIDHISDSLKVHGLGVMNTTVNFTYQFLIRKFKLLSEFLFDDHIKSRLMKANKYYRETKQALNLQFPYEYAEKFNLEIRKLGVNPEDNTTFIDQFRRQITEIGNALGYVRMVRSGGLHHVSAALSFLPDLKAIVDYHSMTVTESLSADCQTSAQSLNGVIHELYSNLTAGSDYFSLLVSIFMNVLNDNNHAHLQLFYLIVPSLMINHVEQLKSQKEKLGKMVGKQEASFTDDGFALGIAYILRVLRLDDLFDSLHWFQSVENFMEEKKKYYRKQIETFQSSMPIKKSAASSGDKKKNAKKPVAASDNDSEANKAEEELAALNTQLKRYIILQREFQLLFFSTSGARIFFQEQQAQQKKAAEAEVDGTSDASLSSAASASQPTASPVSVSVSGGDTGIPSAPPMAPPL